jgi:hypothetical protein
MIAGAGLAQGPTRERSLRNIKAAGLSFVRLAAGLALVAGLAGTVCAEETPPRLQLAATPIPADGLYEASDTLQFVIDHRDQYVRLRFMGSDEVFYLSSEPAPLGGRVLKYDTGEVALQVAGWGGVTLYTDAAKGGIPAEHTDLSNPVDPMPVAVADVKAFAQKLASALASHDDLAVGFAADWDSLGSDPVRALAVDAMRDATYAVEMAARGVHHDVLSDRLHIVKVTAGMKPGAIFGRGILVVTYAPQNGPSARPSSLAIVRVLNAGL